MVRSTATTTVTDAQDSTARLAGACETKKIAIILRHNKKAIAVFNYYRYYQSKTQKRQHFTKDNFSVS